MMCQLFNRTGATSAVLFTAAFVIAGSGLECNSKSNQRPSEAELRKEIAEDALKRIAEHSNYDVYGPEREAFYEFLPARMGRGERDRFQIATCPPNELAKLDPATVRGLDISAQQKLSDDDLKAVAKLT